MYTKMFIGEPKGKRQPGRASSRRQDNTKMDNLRNRTGLMWLTAGTGGGVSVHVVLNLRVP